MKFLTILLGLTLIFGLIGCSKDNSSPTDVDKNNDNWQPSSEFYVTFKMGDERIEFTFADIDVVSSDNEFWVSSGPSEDSDWDEVFEIESAPLSVDTFDLKDGFGLKYIPDGDENNYPAKYRAGTSFQGSDGQLIVSKIDIANGVIEGQFSGKLKLQDGQGVEYIEMTNGIFKGQKRLNNNFDSKIVAISRTSVQWFDPVQKVWIKNNDRYGTNYGIGGVVINNKIYVCGCGNDGDGLNIYDHTNDIWINKTPMNIGRRWFGITSLDNNIYIIGGYNGPALSDVEVYNINNDNWTARANILKERHSISACTVNNKIYAISGGENGDFPDVEMYDYNTNIWTKLADIPTPRQRAGIAVFENKIYVIGGWKESVSQICNNVEVYDPVTNKWESRSPMPTARSIFGITVFDNRIYAIGGNIARGGHSDSEITSKVEIYNPHSDSWETGIPLIEKMGNLFAVTIQ